MGAGSSSPRVNNVQYAPGTNTMNSFSAQTPQQQEDAKKLLNDWPEQQLKQSDPAEWQRRYDATKGMTIQNPGTIDLASANPALYAELSHMQGVRDQMEPGIQNYLDPSRYAAMTQELQSRGQTSTMNRYAQMGLGGSSLAMGAADEQSRQIGMGMKNQQLSDMTRAYGLESSMSGGINQDISRIQAGYAGFQNQALNLTLQDAQAQAQANAANAQIWGSMIGAAGTIGGAALAGPAGAAVGGTLAGGAAKGFSMSGDNLGGYWNSNPYTQD